MDDGKLLQLLVGAIGAVMALFAIGFMIVNSGATKDQCEALGTGLGWAGEAARDGAGNILGGLAKGLCNMTNGRTPSG